ncbi:MAG: hypothetical protein WCL56_09705, partial [Sediminibacterium sp.]
MFKKINIVPRWFILLLDLGVTKMALLLAIFIKQELSFKNITLETLVNTLLFMGIVNLLVFASLKTYSGIVRYTGLQDAFRIGLSVLSSSVILFFFTSDILHYSATFLFTKSIIIVYATFSFLGLITYRVMVKSLFSYSRNYSMQKKNVVIFGASEAGVATKRVLEHDTINNIQILAFIDDDKKKNNKGLDGINIIDFNEFTKLIQKEPVAELVLASFSISVKRKNELVDFCLDHDIKILSVPPYGQWAEGKFNSSQIRSIKIEDLLERDPIFINNQQISNQVKGKRILVTGAA